MSAADVEMTQAPVMGEEEELLMSSFTDLAPTPIPVVAQPAAPPPRPVVQVTPPKQFLPRFQPAPAAAVVVKEPEPLAPPQAASLDVNAKIAAKLPGFNATAERELQSAIGGIVSDPHVSAKATHYLKPADSVPAVIAAQIVQDELEPPKLQPTPPVDAPVQQARVVSSFVNLAAPPAVVKPSDSPAPAAKRAAELSAPATMAPTATAAVEPATAEEQPTGEDPAAAAPAPAAAPVAVIKDHQPPEMSKTAKPADLLKIAAVKAEEAAVAKAKKEEKEAAAKQQQLPKKKRKEGEEEHESKKKKKSKKDRDGDDNDKKKEKKHKHKKHKEKSSSDGKKKKISKRDYVDAEEAEEHEGDVSDHGDGLDERGGEDLGDSSESGGEDHGKTDYVRSGEDGDFIADDNEAEEPEDGASSEEAELLMREGTKEDKKKSKHELKQEIRRKWRIAHEDAAAAIKASSAGVIQAEDDGPEVQLPLVPSNRELRKLDRSEEIANLDIVLLNQAAVRIYNFVDKNDILPERGFCVSAVEGVEELTAANAGVCVARLVPYASILRSMIGPDPAKVDKPCEALSLSGIAISTLQLMGDLGVLTQEFITAAKTPPNLIEVTYDKEDFSLRKAPTTKLHMQCGSETFDGDVDELLAATFDNIAFWHFVLTPLDEIVKQYGSVKRGCQLDETLHWKPTFIKSISELNEIIPKDFRSWAAKQLASLAKRIAGSRAAAMKTYKDVEYELQKARGLADQ